MTSLMRVGSFVDSVCGSKIFDAFFDPLLDIPDGESVEKLHVCPLYVAIQTTNNYLYWRGVYPFNERRKLFERSKSKMKKHVTFDTSEITPGAGMTIQTQKTHSNRKTHDISEVRTKSSPIYAAGSVAINFSGGTPLVSNTLVLGLKYMSNVEIIGWHFDGVNVDTERDLSFPSPIPRAVRAAG
jgi:hypothetical protein